MTTLQWTDEKILEAVKGKPEERLRALRHFFSDEALLPAVTGYVLKHGGNRQDGEDVFQDAAILFERNLREGRFRGDSSLRTYFIGIAKWRWVSNRRKNKSHIELEKIPEREARNTPDVRVIEGERRRLIDAMLAQLSKKCEQLLKLYMLRHSMKEIAQALGIKGGGEQAKKDAYKCRKKLRAFIQENPHLQDHLKPN